LLHLLGFKFDRFSFKVQILDGNLTGINPAKVIKELAA
jgi:hypothetical protein